MRAPLLGPPCAFHSCRPRKSAPKVFLLRQEVLDVLHHVHMGTSQGGRRPAAHLNTFSTKNTFYLPRKLGFHPYFSRVGDGNVLAATKGTAGARPTWVPSSHNSAQQLHI